MLLCILMGVSPPQQLAKPDGTLVDQYIQPDAWWGEIEHQHLASWLSAWNGLPLQVDFWYAPLVTSKGSFTILQSLKSQPSMCKAMVDTFVQRSCPIAA